ncbi:hypothetical protein B0H13DRAFT_2371010 [Mycena leptocephala]|nr:hypothetical protein B0H13DRAFT_2371010 [Mycena leptocephala]
MPRRRVDCEQWMPSLGVRAWTSSVGSEFWIPRLGLRAAFRSVPPPPARTADSRCSDSPPLSASPPHPPLPIGAPLGDGLHYVPNPRFDADGQWRRRSEWPAELR